ncbi:MAG: tetratricopeptide repeat protein, partial [Myxococcales bacterium]|nr:tetratricopeptide repeat protein [Myxococcales bacterium]
MRALVTVALCVVVCAPAARAADSGEALRQEGMRQYDAGHYDAAIAKLEQAYAVSHDGSILYALGQAKRRRGDCRGAIETFEQFIAANPPTSAVGAARFQIARCLEQLAKSPAPPTA